MPMLCKKCRRPLPECPPGPGRPPAYCSPTCRRMAGFEITRTVRTIDGLESELSDGRSCLMIPFFVERRPLIEAELALQRERLHELLLDDDDQKETEQ